MNRVLARSRSVVPPKRSWSFFSPDTIYPKLTIGKSNDVYEQDADVMAEKVMTMPETELIQRKCAKCQEEDQLQRQSDEEEETTLQSCREGQQETIMPVRARGEGEIQASPQLQQSLMASKGRGSPLPCHINRFMGPAFGNDFSYVRVHTDQTAGDMNRSIGAKAFTHGSDIYFKGGQYDPGSFEGKKLLAHELTHVIQQTGYQKSDGSLTVQRTPSQSGEVDAILSKSIGGEVVKAKYLKENPPDTDNYPLNKLYSFFNNYTNIQQIGESSTDWMRFDLEVSYLMLTDSPSSIDPGHWTFWLRNAGGNLEVKLDESTQIIFSKITLALRQGTLNPESLVQISQRGLYFRKIMNENGLNWEKFYDYGNYCGKGGSGPVLDSFDQVCWNHDECYRNNGCSIFDDIDRPECQLCDRIAVQEWLSAIDSEPMRYGSRNNVQYPCFDCNCSTLFESKKQRCEQECFTPGKNCN